MARKIMGRNFLPIEASEINLKTLTKRQRSALAVIPFSEETLKSCAMTHVLVADIGLSIINIRKLVRENLFWKNYSNDLWMRLQEFATRTETARWRLIRKTPVENSFSKTPNEQEALVGDDLIPSTRQVVNMMILHFLATGERLFDKEVYVRTCDVDQGSLYVTVGDFSKIGFLITKTVGDVLGKDQVGVASSKVS
ncbi:hypothetical protein HY771_03720 [Candidatus Uhrbacteria bacterium]|nr:hypothetical protein [Candidatus Uhrbacteria bacterium]MBI4812380.1 hypothetical protein [Candidatus Falkowbacteria bacterium]